MSKLERELGNISLSSETFLERFKDISSKIYESKIQAIPYKSRHPRDVEPRIVNVALSDLHFHALLDKREVPMQYGPVEEARRIAAVVAQVAEYKEQYRGNSILYIHLLGDIIQGQLHDARDGATLAEQSCAAIHLLSQAVAFLSSQYERVVVRCTTGNHGRNSARHVSRAVHEKFDSIETIIYFGIKQATAHIGNVKIEIPRTPYFTYTAFNRQAFMTHGDTVLSPGFPGKLIDIGNIRKQINEINGRLATESRYSLFTVGHVHVGSIVHLPNGSIFMSNGALIPADSFGVSVGSFDTACGQWIWESVKNHIVGDHRFAVVDAHTDADASLDKIIKPFKDF